MMTPLWLVIDDAGVLCVVMWCVPISWFDRRNANSSIKGQVLVRDWRRMWLFIQTRQQNSRLTLATQFYQDCNDKRLPTEPTMTWGAFICAMRNGVAARLPTSAAPQHGRRGGQHMKRAVDSSNNASNRSVSSAAKIPKQSDDISAEEWKYLFIDVSEPAILSWGLMPAFSESRNQNANSFELMWMRHSPN